MDDPLPPQNKTRIVNLDVMRGFFVSLALLQHFAFYWNFWFVAYFKDAGKGVFTYYQDMIGKNVYLADPIAFHLLVFFTPWVSQVYLSLSAFNLSRRNKEDFTRTFPQKLMIFVTLYFLFVFENFLVASTFGEAISFYPLMCWMVVLTLISIFYRQFGIRGVLFLFLISFLPWFWSEIFIMGDRFERFMRYTVHPYFEYDARLEYFLPSGCLGFLLGYLHFHKREWGIGRYVIIMGIGVVLIGVYNLFGEPFTLNRYDVLATEHDQSETLFGTLRILGINSMVIMGALLLHEKGISFKSLTPLKWIGINSLMIFGLHRILYVHIFVPIRLYLGAIFGWKINPNFFGELISVFCVCLIVLIIKKSNILSLFGKA